MVRVSEAKLAGKHALRLRFNDKTEGTVNLWPELEGPMFEALRDPGYFASFRLDPELHTVVWPNGADFAPDFLYELAKVPG